MIIKSLSQIIEESFNPLYLEEFNLSDLQKKGEELGKNVQDKLSSEVNIDLTTLKAETDKIIDNAVETTNETFKTIGDGIRLLTKFGNLAKKFSKAESMDDPAFAEYMDLFAKYETIIDKTPESIKNTAQNFIGYFGKNPIVEYIFNISNNNPAIFYSILISVPVFLVGATIGGTMFIRSKLSKKVTKSEIESAKKKLDVAISKSEKKKLAKEFANLSAKALVQSKLENK